MSDPLLDPLPPDAPVRSAVPDVDILTPGSAAALVSWTLLAAVVAAALTFLLPQAPYLRWQQAHGTILFHSQWVYDRIVHDATPIDVAVVGTSRLEAGISPVVLEQSLRQRLGGQPVHVANLSLVQSGRDLHYSIIKLLLSHHPEVKLILLSLDGDTNASHPLFRVVGDVGDVATSRLLVNEHYFPNLLYIPFRNISLAAQTLFPHAFGVSPDFDPRQYAGVALDRTLGYRDPEGKLVNGDQSASSTELAHYAEEVVRNHLSTLRLRNWLDPDDSLPVERWAVRRIAALAHEKGVRLAFVQLPMYQVAEQPEDLRFYQRLAPILSQGPIGTDPSLYANGAHLNRKGAIAESTWLAKAIAPVLAEGAPHPHASVEGEESDVGK